MSHPSLVRLHQTSCPRILFSGESLSEVPLPAGARVLYSRVGRDAGPADVEEKIRRALAHPVESESLSRRLRAGQRVCVVLDASYLPEPGRGAQDPRTVALDVLLKLFTQHDVRDITVVVAGGVERLRNKKQLLALVGPRVFKKLGAANVFSHDAEGESLVRIADAGNGQAVLLAERVRDAELSVSIGLHGGGYSGFGGPLLRGVGDVAGYLRAADAGALSDWLPSERATFGKLPWFAVELVLDGPRFQSQYAFLSTNEDDLSTQEQARYGLFRQLLRRLPQLLRQKLLDETLAMPQMSAVFAGDPFAAAAAAESELQRRSEVFIGSQADVLVAGVPHRAAYNEGSLLNPLLVSAFVQAQLPVLRAGAPLVKAGGTLVVMHPCTDAFDQQQHAAYVPFFNDLLPRTRELSELRRWSVDTAAKDPALVQLFRNGAAYHPLHPYLLWAKSEASRRHFGRVIVVGADNEHVPHLLGFETTQTLDQALYRARGGINTPQEILCIHSPVNSLGTVSNESSFASDRRSA